MRFLAALLLSFITSSWASCSVTAVNVDKYFIDISDQTVALPPCDDCFSTFDLLFPIYIQCAAISTININTNGFINTADNDFSATTDGVDCPIGGLCPALSDWTNDISIGASGSVHIGYIGEWPYRTGIISWVNISNNIHLRYAC